MDAGLRELERQAATGDPDAVVRLSVARLRAGSLARPIVRMQDFVRFKASDTGYWGHLGALKYFLTADVRVLFSESDDDYQGSIYALLFVPAHDVYAIWSDYFGSCGGCDSLIDASTQDAFDYIKATMAEGNTRQFRSIADAAHYLRTSEDFSWSYGGGVAAFREELCKRAGVPSERLADDDD